MMLDGAISAGVVSFTMPVQEAVHDLLSVTVTLYVPMARFEGLCTADVKEEGPVQL
jgi:hypothetical protein